MVMGHVRQVVSIRDSELGVPVYRAVIDYMVPTNPTGAVGALESAGIWAAAVTCPALMTECSSHDLQSSKHRLHIRKQFESQQPLEEGFANVELLVLPHEPTQCVIRDDFEKELEEQQEYMDEEWCCWKASKCRKLSIIFSGSLVLASIAGAIHVVEHLEPTKQEWGWLTICLGAALLLPGALFIQWCLQAFQDALDFGSEKQGIIIDDKTAQEPFSPSCGGFTDGREEADDADFRSIRTSVTDTAGCYFISLPQASKRMPRIFQGRGLLAQQAMGRNASDASASASSISSISIQERSGSGVSV